MKAILRFVELENFKSYSGFHRIGPLESFTAVIGPNGSGKSNFMDAISFVMGEKTSSLRVSRLSDLIHGASVRQPVSRSAQVTAVFSMDDDAEMRFTRLVHGSSSDHKINGETVSMKVYMQELESLGINVKAKNFLVFQGAVECIAIKNPKERTALFEEISGSGALKEEYDKLKAEMLKAEENTQFAFKKKKGMTAERKEAEQEKEEAERYLKLKNEVKEKQLELELFRLYHSQNEISDLKEEVRKTQKTLEKKITSKDQTEALLNEMIQQHTPVSEEVNKIDQDIRKLETEVNKKRMAVIGAKVKTTHLQKSADLARKSLTQAINKNNTHQDSIKELETKLEEVEKKRAEFEESVAMDFESQGLSVQLEDTQINEYHRLKNEAISKSARYTQELDSITREQKSDQDRLDNAHRRLADIEHRMQRKTQEIEMAQMRSEKLVEYISQAEASLGEQNRTREELSEEVRQCKERLTELQQELERVTNELYEARVSQQDATSREKKQEVVERLKELFSGVYDRVINMCQPIHQRYRVAITRVFGKYMDAIVVDSEKTVQQCIQYLKEQRVGRETFLPLDYITVKPLKERLRDITDPKNVKLIFDLVQYSPPEIKPAVLFVTNNVLVCETVEDATKLAFEMEDRNRYDAVALDGTFFAKSGIISGGTYDLEKKARRWDDKHLSKMKSSRVKLSEELREVTKNLRKEYELNTLESQIRGNETRLKYSKTDKEATDKHIAQLQKELDNMKDELNTVHPLLDDIKKTMSEREVLIRQVKEKTNTVEDDVFADFCKTIGVSNIRQYEKRELQAHSDHASRRLQFDKQKNNILNQLEYEKTRDTNATVDKWKRSVQHDEDALEEAKQIEIIQIAELDKCMQNLEKLRNEKLAKKSDCDQTDEEISKLRRALTAINKSIHSLQKHINSTETKIEKKNLERHSILKQCKMDDIMLPMIRGNMDDIEREGRESESTLEFSSEISSQVIYEREARIVMDYSSLPNYRKELDDLDDIRKTGEHMQRHINDLKKTLDLIKIPNMKATQQLDVMREKLQQTNYDLDTARKQAKKMQQAFEKLKKTRYELFMTFFEHVLNEIDTIYKALAQNPSAQAFLGPENPEEPYLGGINYNCVAPGKRFQPMSNLSGGEKTIAALSLLFGIHSYHPAPFLILDEIDAALDKTNIGKVTSYISKMKSNVQIIIISLKEEFYQKSDAIIGICPDPGECLKSRVLTMDLRKYQTQRTENHDKPLGT
nr:structural maintenance of chromosomes protein 1A-like [Procambarus clarkii]